MKVFLVEVGILLDETDKEFDAYSTVYDKKHGYFDENQFYIKDKFDAIKQVDEYVKQGNDGTYGIVSETYVNDDLEDFNYVIEEEYLLDDVVYSIAKNNGQVVTCFLKK